ncbi:MAG: lysostaphin resistance A-like protein, partial [Fimbriiglobus sp.]
IGGRGWVADGPRDRGPVREDRLKAKRAARSTPIKHDPIKTEFLIVHDRRRPCGKIRESAVPTDITAEIPRMAEALGLVAAVAVPLGLVCAALSRRPVLPRWNPPRSPWSAVDILFLFCLNLLLPILAMVVLGLTSFDASAAIAGPAGSAATGQLDWQLFGVLRATAVGSLILLGVAAGVRWFAHFNPPRVSLDRFLPDVALGVGAWLAVTPVVLAVYFAATAVVGQPDEHPLTRGNAAADPVLLVLFAGMVCGLTPFVEEFLFRGMLVGWVAERRGRYTAVLLAGLVFPCLFAPRPESLGFAVLLAAGGLLVRRRTTQAIYVTSMFFAVAHSAVWPSPVPLFVLGLALGWLTARTGGIVASTVAHGLFNAVSVVYLLRGGG